MNSRDQIKKEVSCNVFISTFELAKRKNIDLKLILKDIPYSLDYLLNKNERIEWNVLCKFMDNIRPFLTISDFEKMGALDIKKGFNLESVLSGFMFSSLNKIPRIISEKIIKSGEHNVSCIKGEIESITNNRIRLKYYVDEEHEFFPEFVYVIRGTFLEIGKQLKYSEFKIETIWIHKGAILDISWKKEGTLFRLKRGLTWIFHIKKTFLDLTDSQEQILKQYNELDKSKTLLQRQTVQLKTAYEIAKSIRQSFDINTTLNAITNTLVCNAGFSSAQIRLFKDIEGNKFEIEALYGNDERNINPVKKSINVDSVNIGELTIYPKIGTEISELEEMLDYLLPIINISIHDSLVLRTVTDYKNNLETKVEKRTDKLQKAQEELSKTIYLLKKAQLAQNRFFTNISHEFRTPLTLILGPVKQIIERIKDEKTKEDLQVVHKNANNLLGLVNQLLDISKLESGNMKLQASSEKIIPLLKALLQSFCSYAERKRINLKFNATCLPADKSEEEITVYVDKEKFEKIITNILSNAFKFTPEGGEIEVVVKPKSTSQEMSFKKSPVLKKEEIYRNQLSNPLAGKLANNNDFVEISIRDTGIGIPKENINYIFDRFYQVDGIYTREQAGTGIGLSLTKELVELHKGKIEVESKEGKGTKFTISIPLGIKLLKSEEISESKKEEKILPFTVKPFYQDVIKNDSDSIGETDTSARKIGKPVLLIIEDNFDVRAYIKNNMNIDYKIVEACNGEDGWNSAVKHFPDLIISDIMMPKMDGFELCKKLKTDQRTSHIPVILLTAKASNQDKIDGFETGADEYIMKPFDMEELRSRIKNLIEQRKRIHEHLKKHGLFEIEEEKVTPADQKFLQRVAEIINEYLSEPDFNVEKLTEKLALGRSNLNKKFIALIGEPPVEFIRRTRLNRAAELIEKNFGNLSEIALEAGFNNPAYFSACFKKQFGVIPSRYLLQDIEQKI